MSDTSPITTHVLDTSLGRPASGVAVRISVLEDGAYREIASATTDGDGRIRDLLRPGALVAAIYRIDFELDAYFARTARTSFYPSAQVVFRVTAPDEHHHVPLLLNPFGYSTYRGS